MAMTLKTLVRTTESDLNQARASIVALKVLHNCTAIPSLETAIGLRNGKDYPGIPGDIGAQVWNETWNQNQS